MWFDKENSKKLRKIEREVECLHRDVQRLLRILSLHHIDFMQVPDFNFWGDNMPTNFSIVAGTNGTFTAVLTPPNGALAAGEVPKWAASDTSVIVTPSADGLTCEAAVPVGVTAVNFDFDIVGVSADASVGILTSKHTITIVQPPPPPPPALTAIDFAQTA